jgi:hypothetical protein
MRDMLILVGLLVAWFVVNRWVLPSMGVKT